MQKQNEFCNGFTGKKLMVYNGTLMETIRISVMVSIVFFSRVNVLTLELHSAVSLDIRGV